MSVKTFAAIDLGSFELSMKVYEISSKGMREIDHVRHMISLGSDSYNTGKISYKKIDELCRVLKKFGDIMASYNVTDYKVYGTSALRETNNTLIIIDQIKNRTGFDVEVISNSEQRFLDYKSIASKGAEFNNIIEKTTAIVDIGGGNIQVSLFDNDTLVTTQSLKIGVLRVYERMAHIKPNPLRYEAVLEDIIDSELNTFRKMYLKDKMISNVIIVDDYLSPVITSSTVKNSKKGIIEAFDYLSFVNEINSKNDEEVADFLSISEKDAGFLRVSSEIVKRFIQITDAERIWAPGVTLCDGIAYEYAEKKKLKMIAHDFEKDILASATNISKRYMCSKKRAAAMETVALTLFDGMSKMHGMQSRERFLMQLAIILHDCGKFINMNNVGECSYSIIMNTEMIGLSHEEREIVAFAVKFYYEPFIYYEELDGISSLDRNAYLTVAKLTALLRVAGSLDRGSKQNLHNIKANVKDETLVITTEDNQDLLFEADMFNKAAEFFGEVYSIEPVIVKKKID